MTENAKVVNHKQGQKKHQRGRRAMRDVLIEKIGTDYLVTLENAVPTSAAHLANIVENLVDYKPSPMSLKSMLLRDVSSKRLTMKNFPALWNVTKHKRGRAKNVEVAA
jgi:hypothetical protein